MLIVKLQDLGKSSTITHKPTFRFTLMHFLYPSDFAHIHTDIRIMYIKNILHQEFAPCFENCSMVADCHGSTL